VQRIVEAYEGHSIGNGGGLQRSVGAE
jgi:hypothetical protein